MTINKTSKACDLKSSTVDESGCPGDIREMSSTLEQGASKDDWVIYR